MGQIRKLPATQAARRTIIKGQLGAIGRPPQTDEELWHYVRTLFGVRIPRVHVCAGHATPFEAFADAYFCRYGDTIWKGSRGLAGKSFTLALLGLTEAVALGATVTILGGSGAQSKNVHDYMDLFLSSPRAPRHRLDGDPTRYTTSFKGGNYVAALMASTRSVRGPHPQRLRLDEVDEMGLDIMDAALGQPMEKEGTHGMVPPQTVYSSTHQYPDKTMTEVLKRAQERKWPVYEWCYRESLQPHGWLNPEEIPRVQARVTSRMWEVEYELGEPAIIGRAIDTDAVQAMFTGEIIDDVPGKLYTFAEYDNTKRYCAGADWGARRDWSVFALWDASAEPWRLVGYKRQQRRPWPVMVADFDDLLDRFGIPRENYGARLNVAHDQTGLGDVVHQYLKHECEGIWLSGRVRFDLLNDYVLAIEHRRLSAPRLRSMYDAHRYASDADLYGSGHPDDTIIAGAMSWSRRGNDRATNLGPIRAHNSLGARTPRSRNAPSSVPGTQPPWERD